MLLLFLLYFVIRNFLAAKVQKNKNIYNANIFGKTLLKVCNFSLRKACHYKMLVYVYVFYMCKKRSPAKVEIFSRKDKEKEKLLVNFLSLKYPRPQRKGELMRSITQKLNICSCGKFWILPLLCQLAIFFLVITFHAVPTLFHELDASNRSPNAGSRLLNTSNSSLDASNTSLDANNKTLDASDTQSELVHIYSLDASKKTLYFCMDWNEVVTYRTVRGVGNKLDTYWLGKTCVCVCVRERERERDTSLVLSLALRICVYVCVRERERDTSAHAQR
ncbi:hypothetical protein RFI_27572 [Reticulomyxa filosa]|uniref:Uncharacterized protein n=1 Tax=Reticulomyxa filosa TaxID=46433 RepID=X6M9W9_RETFI|nr:hypothetical protein RFI_27572 [Reticulomyxa filosa]|eukprot:ETO09805.1 hypothetical protein RFI_27572 [Reticulomyxa filosa]